MTVEQAQEGREILKAIEAAEVIIEKLKSTRVAKTLGAEVAQFTVIQGFSYPTEIGDKALSLLVDYHENVIQELKTKLSLIGGSEPNSVGKDIRSLVKLYDCVGGEVSVCRDGVVIVMVKGEDKTSSLPTVKEKLCEALFKAVKLPKIATDQMIRDVIISVTNRGI